MTAKQTSRLLGAGACLMLVIVFICIPNRSKTNIRIVIHDGDAPIPGALATVPGEAKTLESDSQGRVMLDPKSLGKIIAIAARGYFIERFPVSGPENIVQLKRVEGDNPEYDWVHSSKGEGNCAGCHQEIHKQWQSGAHGNGLSNSRFLKMYKSGGNPQKESKNWSLWHDFPEGRQVCASCHAPSLKPLEDGLEDITSVDPARIRGIECDFCHKVSGLRDREIGLSHGRDLLELRRPVKGQVFFGPLADAQAGDDSYSPIFKDSRYCASCHEGVLFGQRVYTTYSEWLASPSALRGESCQSCHMKPDGKMINIAPGSGGLERNAQTLASHDLMPGGKLAMLQNAIRMEVSVVPQGERTIVMVQLLALGVGHKVPTGHVDHHLLLKVDAIGVSKTLKPIKGLVLSNWLGKSQAGEGGVVLGRPNLNGEMDALVPFWKAIRDPEDTRLEPGKIREYRWEYPADVSRVRVQLSYRAGWDSDENAMVIQEKTIKP